MKKLLLSLLLGTTISAFSQEKETAKDSIPYAHTNASALLS